MKRRQLLSSGLEVSEIGLGCMSFSGFYGASSPKQAHETLAQALDLGIDFLDTSNVYGMGLSEEIIGAFIGGDADKFRIATKAGIWRDADHNNRGFNNSKAYLRDELEGSLRRLGLERVDLFYVHRRDHSVEVEDVMETLLDLKTEGKIAGIGFSEIAPATLRRACAVGPVDAVQSEYSLWTRQPELGMRQACSELGVSLVPYAPLGRGMLADGTLSRDMFAKSDFRHANPRFVERNFSLNLARAARFKALAADLGVAASALALAWCLAQGPQIIPIPGTRRADHLAACASASDLNLTREVLDQIDAILPVGWAHGDRYSQAQWNGPEGYC